MTTVLFVGAGVFQHPALKAAKARGLNIIALDSDPKAAGRAEADVVHCVDIKDHRACLEALGDTQPDGILTVATEAGVVTAAKLAQALGRPGLDVEAAKKATDKHLMRTAFKGANLPSPEFINCTSLDAIRAAYAELGPKVVIKPANGAGSRGVTFVDHADQIEAAYLNARAIAQTASILVEAFMPGEEVAVEAFMIQGVFHPLCISDKTRTQPPYLLDLSIAYPSARSEDQQQAILNLAEAGARALGIDHAPLHIEIMMTPEGPKLVEIAARGAGFHVYAEIVPWVTGIDTLNTQIDMALGREITLPTPLKQGAVLEFPTFPPGRVTEITGVDTLVERDDILFSQRFVSVGDPIRPLTAGGDRALAFAVKAPDLDHARERRDDVMKTITIKTEAEG